MQTLSARRILACLAVAGLALTSCGQPADEPGTGSGDGKSGDGRTTVVTSTDVYGDIASTVGGDRVDVTALISGASKDPHSYEATVRDKLAVSEADLVVENGGGYDEFLRQLTESVKTDPGRIVSAVEVSGLEPEAEEFPEDHTHAEHSHGGHSDGAFNEHVWYDLATMSALADQLASQLGELDPDGAQEFEANAAGFTASLDKLTAELAAVVPGAEHRNVAITEPVPLYLLQDAGLTNVTPAEYSEAIEDGSGVPVSAAREMDQLLSSAGVAFLAYNRQTESSQTKLAAETAARAGVPVVSFTETLPEGKNYLQWMESNIDAMGAAVGN